MKDESPANESCSAVQPSSFIPYPLIAVAVVLALVIFVFPLLIRFPLLDPDEGLHAEIAREMAEGGDWITPRFLGEPFFDKPILYCWAEAASLWALGPNEAAVRLPGLMFGLLGAVTTGLLAWRMFNRLAGLIAGILYATTILPTALAQAASHDVALIPWINLCLLLLWQSHETPRHCNGGGLHTAAYTLGAGFFLGLSILTKGLEGAAVVGLAYGGWSLVTRRVGWGVLARGGALLAVAAIVAAPWYLAVEWRNPGYLSYYFVQRHLLGLTTATQPHGEQPWWYYLPILLGGGLPWIGYLPVVAREVGRGMPWPCSGRACPPCGQPGTAGKPARYTAAGAMPLLWCWLIGWLLLLSVAPSKLATYLWPAFPPLAILAAVAWARPLGASARRALSRTFVWSSWSGPILLPAAVWIVQILFGVRFPWPVWLAVGLAAAAAPLPLIPWRLAERAEGHVGWDKRSRVGWDKRSAVPPQDLGPETAGGTALRLSHPTPVAWREIALAAAALSMAVQFVAVMTTVLPPVAECFSARDLAAYFNRAGQLPPRLWLAQQRVGSLVFYLDPQLRAGLKPGQVQPLVADRSARLEPGDVVAVPRPDRYHVVPRLDFGSAPCQPVGRYRLYTIRTPLVLPGQVEGERQ